MGIMGAKKPVVEELPKAGPTEVVLCKGCKHTPPGNFCPFCGRIAESPTKKPIEKTGGRTHHIHVDQSPIKPAQTLQETLKKRTGKVKLTKAQRIRRAAIILQCFFRRLKHARAARESVMPVASRRNTVHVERTSTPPLQIPPAQVGAANKSGALSTSRDDSSEMQSVRSKRSNATAISKSGNSNKPVWRHMGDKYRANKHGKKELPILGHVPEMTPEQYHGMPLQQYLADLKLTAEEATALYTVCTEAPMGTLDETEMQTGTGQCIIASPTEGALQQPCPCPVTILDESSRDFSPSPLSVAVAQDSILGKVSVAGRWIGPANGTLFSEPLMRLSNLPCRTPCTTPRKKKARKPPPLDAELVVPENIKPPKAANNLNTNTTNATVKSKNVSTGKTTKDANNLKPPPPPPTQHDLSFVGAGQHPPPIQPMGASVNVQDTVNTNYAPYQSAFSTLSLAGGRSLPPMKGDLAGYPPTAVPNPALFPHPLHNIAAPPHTNFEPTPQLAAPPQLRPLKMSGKARGTGRQLPAAPPSVASSTVSKRPHRHQHTKMTLSRKQSCLSTVPRRPMVADLSHVSIDALYSAAMGKNAV
eukprot:TRINITY_DN27257_c0_g1_i1.p1 TRINITY_DN27257_c0_g1~~TRINITY_DN27257_c0_g1_i1.p1  ORF type:complete len:672 (-),score=42.65 TRINITY_DN27257_c0_g1_i1:1390-3153(-)